MISQFDFGFEAELHAPRRKGNRGAGCTRFSWVKHGLAYKIVVSQMMAYRVSHPDDRILLVDGNAGDGVGVPELKDQNDLFGHQTTSRPTAQMMVELANDDGNADVVLCEKDQKKRASLMHLFRDVIVLENHSEAIRHIRPVHKYAIWLSDPCGASHHGVDHMVAFDRKLRGNRLPCDFVVIFNEQFMDRLSGVHKPNKGWQTSKKLYLPMDDPQWWLQQTNKSVMARTVRFDGGPSFKYRVMLLSNYLGRAAQCRPFVEVIRREEKQHG